LLEVLVVIAIIALLAAFVVPEFMGTADKAKRDLTQRMVEDGGNINSALNLYRLHMGTYPEELEALTQSEDDLEDEEKDKYGGPYIQDPEKLKDAWGNELNYKFPGDVGGDAMYDLWSSGPDGDDEGGDGDDIKNWKDDS